MRLSMQSDIGVTVLSPSNIEITKGNQVIVLHYDDLVLLLGMLNEIKHKNKHKQDSKTTQFPDEILETL